MTNKERQAFIRKIDRITARVAKKRDELRELVSDVEALVSSVDEAAEEMEWTIQHLTDARRSLDDAADKASQYA